jgi:AmpE protein
MNFIIILIAMLTRRYVDLGRSVKRYAWVQKYAEFCQQILAAIHVPYVIIIVLLLPILLIIAFLQHALAHDIFYLLYFVLSIFILWYCLWPISLQEQFSQKVTENMTTDNLHELSRQLLYQANNQIFAVLFWFIVLGPWGCLMYRLVSQLTYLNMPSKTSSQRLAENGQVILNILDWIPARLTGFCYVLVGDFSKGFSAWLHYFNSGLHANQDLLVATGYNALHIDEVGPSDVEAVRKILRLIERSIIVWLGVLLIFTLGTWGF